MKNLFIANLAYINISSKAYDEFKKTIKKLHTDHKANELPQGVRHGYGVAIFYADSFDNAKNIFNDTIKALQPNETMLIFPVLKKCLAFGNIPGDIMPLLFPLIINHKD